MRTVVQWVTEQWCHAVPLTGTDEPPVVAEVVVTEAVAALVVAEAEVLCAAAAAVERVMV